MGAFRPVAYSKKELAGLSPSKRRRLQKAIVRHLERHKGIRRIVRRNTKTLYRELKG